MRGPRTWCARRRQRAGSRARSGQARWPNRAELVGAQADATQTVSTIDAAKATADRLQSEINDAVLVSPIRARVETRLTEPGEVLPQGGRVFSLNDLSDVYMYVYLPESVTGKVPLGSEARIVLDAAPQYPIRAYVSFVSPMAQFTPKTVETAEERHNLTFRVKLQLDKNRLREFEPLVKFGLPGMGYVRYDDNAQWPANPADQGRHPPNLWTADRLEKRELTDGLHAPTNCVARVQRRHPALRQGRRARRRQPRHSRRQDDRPDRPGRRGQVDAARA